ncbi:MAG TPA: hypothetical protein VK981_04730 [Ramlibacter sp.]|nr:hypothetical protein [Ramlibacter sp.]
MTDSDNSLHPVARKPWLAPLCTALLVLHVMVAWALALHSWRNPIANWDMIPYAALVRAEAGIPAADLSRAAYSDVRDYVGPEKYPPLIDDPGADRSYRLAVHRDPAALVDNLKFYAVKPLYIFLSRLAFKVTHNSASAAALVSAIAAALLVSMVPFFFRRRIVALAALWPVLLLGDPPLMLIARVATPDSLALLFVVACALACIRNVHWLVVLALAILAVLSRPDAAILLVPFLACMAWVRRADGSAPWLLACSAAAFALFFYLGKLALPWPTLFWHTFYAREPFPSAISHVVTLQEYLAVIRRTGHALVAPRPLLFFCAGLGLALAGLWRTRRISDCVVLAAVAAGNMVVHFVIFPIDEYGHERMFLGSYILILAAALLTLEKRKIPGLPAGSLERSL